MASEFSISVVFAIMFLVPGVRVPTEFVHGRKVFSTSRLVIVLCDCNRSGGSVISSSSESAIIQ